VNDYFCAICGRDPKVITRAYAHQPFVDGRNYDLICWTCANVPKGWYTDETGEVIVLDHFDPDMINDVREMMAEGWDKVDAEISIKAVRKILKSPKTSFTSFHDNHVFAQLIFGDQIEMELTV